MTVAALILFALIASLSEEVVAELTHEVAIGPATVEFLAIDPLALVMIAWATAPAVRSLYGFWQLRREAHTGPPRHEWEVDEPNGGEN